MIGRDRFTYQRRYSSYVFFYFRRRIYFLKQTLTTIETRPCYSISHFRDLSIKTHLEYNPCQTDLLILYKCSLSYTNATDTQFVILHATVNNDCVLIVLAIHLCNKCQVGQSHSRSQLMVCGQEIVSVHGLKVDCINKS